MKHLTLAALVLLLTAAAVSCGGEKPAEKPKDTDNKNQEEKTDVVTNPIESIGSLADLDFEGQTLKIDISIDSTEWPSSSPYLHPDDKAADIIQDLAFKRNTAIEEKLNLNIDWTETDLYYDGVEDYILKKVRAGEANTDLFINDIGQMFKVVVQGYIRNVYTIDDNYFDFTAEGWQNTFMDRSSIVPDKRYFLVSDYFLDTIRSANVIFANKKILADRFDGMDPLYDLVEAGKWTFDEYKKYVKETYHDLNGDGTRDLGDLYGVNISPYWGGLFFCTTDCRTVSWDENGEPFVDPSTDRTVKLAENMIDIFNSPGYYFEENDNMSQRGLFADGKLLFATWQKIGDFENEVMRNMDDIGIIPYPKLDENQKNYCTNLNNNVEVGAIPVTASEESMIPLSAYLQAQTLYSTEYILPAYYETALKIKYARDNQSARMLDIIRDGITVPTEYMIREYTTEIGINALQTSLQTKVNGVASHTASELSAETKKFEKLVELLESLD